MSSLVSTDVKRGGGISFAEGAESVGGWMRRGGALRRNGGAGLHPSAVDLLRLFLIQFLLFSVARRGLRLDCVAHRDGLGSS